MVALSEGMKTFLGRLETFLIAHTVPKRRASNSKKKTPTSVSWPHRLPNPEDLAYAGFYYKPSAENIDNVQCWVCGSQLDGWDENDVPAFEHLTHAPECGWAINASIRVRLGDPNRVEVDPLSESMIESRRATYMDSWPHEDKKGWKPKVQKMIEAGWCFDPSPDADDGASCHYCHLALDGWEPKDNPLTEHRKRSPDCLFFALIDEYAATRKPSSKKKAKGSRTSKVSRLSTQSNLTLLSEAPSMISIDEALAGTDDSIMTTATNATTTTSTAGKGKKGKAKTTGKTAGKTTRGKLSTQSNQTLMLEAPSVMSIDEAMADVDDSIMTTATNATTMSTTSKSQRGKGKALTKTTRKAARGKKATSASESTNIDELEHPIEMEYEMDAIQPESKGRAKRNTKPIPISQVQDSSVSMMSSPPRQATRTKNARTKAQPRLSEDQSQLHSELHDVLSKALVPKPEHDTPKPKRGTKRMSDGTSKADSPIAILEDEPQAEEAPAPKPKRMKKNSKKPQGPSVIESSEMIEAPEVIAALKAKAVPKPRKGKKSTKKTEDIVMAEFTLDDFPAPPSSARREPSPVHSLPTSSFRGDNTPHQSTPRPPSDEASPEQPTPTPVRSSYIATNKTPQTAVRPGTTLVRYSRASTPSASPQSSDAENRPPSSRPVSVRPPLSTRQVNLTSPSKRANTTAIAGGFASSMPWKPVDLETVFLLAPSAPTLDSALDKENFFQLSGEAETAKVRAGLTSPEKKMSVEEWIFFNASRGEEKLRNECERKVSVFENEGGRALLALEGIQCAV